MRYKPSVPSPPEPAPPAPPPREHGECNKISVRVLLKGGGEFTVRCDSFDLYRNELGVVTRWEAKGCTQNMPVYLDFEQVAAILQVDVLEA